ncbi:DNA-3-methyladenine glycosylase I [Actinoalloteichus spitiensis]|uniref:DNA-3-methyladenine glycosylase I n=1 Tax=Actinoalloteichus spitiensis TaxID=252394 RepID=UPI000362FD4B|nr:DNA-3-methyladenine glycosylase I [Actinoalloteichus spitiensis]
MPETPTPPVPTRAGQEAVLGEDGLRRCVWASTHPVNRHYHDTEWGLPVRGEQELYERITLEGFQAGLSWLTILNKRAAFRQAFCDFVPEKVAAFTDEDVDRLMTNAAIVRNRRKIEAARTNALAVLDLRAEGGLDSFLWSFRPERTPAPRSTAEVPTTSPESTALSTALRRLGFAFVGPTTIHALMEAVGMIDTHLVGCHRRGTSGVWPEG